MDPPKPPPPQSPKKIVVPDLGISLYDIYTHRPLKAGELLSPTTDEEGIHGNHREHHRKVIDNLINVTADEKDYLKEIDDFLIVKKITAKCYIAKAMREFVACHIEWFGERRSRMIEFGKHMAALMIREAVDIGCFRDCSVMLRGVKKITDDQDAKSRAMDPNIAAAS